MAKRTLEERQLALQKKQLDHQRSMDLLDRGLSVAMPIVTSPVVMWLAGRLYIEYITNKANERTGFWGDLQHDFSGSLAITALDAAFIGNAFGGGAGIAQIIGSLRQ